MIFYGPNDLFAYLSTRVKRLKGKNSIDIASYGMYLGVTSDGKDWSKQYPSAVRDFIALVAQKPHRIVIGLYHYLPCKEEGCKHCAEKYNQTLERHKITVERIGLNVRFHPSCHLKYYRVGSTVVVGGINLSSSGSVDAAVNMSAEHSGDLQNIFCNLWQAGTTNLDKFIKN